MKNIHDTPEPGVLEIDYMIITAGDGNAQCVHMFVYIMILPLLIRLHRTSANYSVLNDDSPFISYSSGWNKDPNSQYLNGDAT